MSSKQDAKMHTDAAETAAVASASDDTKAKLSTNDAAFCKLFNADPRSIAVLLDGEVVRENRAMNIIEPTDGVDFDAIFWKSGYQITARIKKAPTYVFGKIVRDREDPSFIPPAARHDHASFPGLAGAGPWWHEAFCVCTKRAVKMVILDGLLTMEVTTNYQKKVLKTVLHRFNVHCNASRCSVASEE